ncbi:hypothetical protein [Streptomyces sp. NPDC058272]|uniref:hypothetical protein n=1 Tax=Streptomyces sp. NPDC058272 TaxID=3346415 RepID=UPI0036EE810F
MSVNDEIESALTDLDAAQIRDALWRGILAVGDALPKPGSHSRTEGAYVDDGTDGRTYRATFGIGQDDGTDRKFEVTVSVRESVDSKDDFWTQHSPSPDIYGLPADVEPGRRVVVDGEHFTIGPGDSGGYGGRRFDVEFFDGRKVTTRDLWHQGVIPPKHRERYPDNARFVPVEGPTWGEL